MAVSTSRVLSYLRISEDDIDAADRDLLENVIMPAAEEWIAGAVGIFDETKARAVMIYLMACQDLWDNRRLVRETNMATSSEHYREMTKSLLAQLSIDEMIDVDGG